MYKRQDKPTISKRISVAQRGVRTLYGPTGLHKDNLKIAKNMLEDIKAIVEKLNSETNSIEDEIKSLNPPYIIGQGID